MRSHRALADRDPTIEALDVEARRALARRWADRADNELSTSTTFAELYRGLVILRAAPSLLEVAARAVDDELRHHGICRHVAERYSGSELRPTRVTATEAPRFSGCSEREARILHVVLHACLNEGVAVAYLGACLDEAEGPLARGAVRDILRDEVVHARLGWTFVVGLSPADRGLVGEALPALLSEVERLWLGAAEVPEDLPLGHGCIGLGGVRRVFADAVSNLLLPGFEHVGVATAPSKAWISEQRTHVA